MIIFIKEDYMKNSNLKSGPVFRGLTNQRRWIMRYLIAFAFLAVFLMGTPVAHALHWDLMYRFCPEQALEVLPVIEDISIPVGCELVDCCPGCPGPGFMDWKIYIGKGAIQGAKLRFEGLSQKSLRQLKISGDAKITDKGEILLGFGEISISGIPTEIDGKVPVGFISPQVADSPDDATKTTTQDKTALAGRDETDFGSDIQIVQYLGAFRVNSFRSRYFLIPCLDPIEHDRLVLNNNTSADNAIAMLDHRTSGCNDDQIVRTTNTRAMGNILSNGACRSTVSVFSDDNAMSYEPNVATWTNSPIDTHTVNLQPIVTVPVSVWVANNALLVTAQNDFANTNLLYNQNNTGIQFAPTYNNFTGNATAAATIGTWCPTAATVGNLQGSAWYTANTLNIYYVNSAFTGVNCGQDRNMNFIGTIANLGSLPHEIGHAYGLRPSASWGHTNAVAGFGNNNIMWGGGPGTRNNFSVGQSFRINTDTTSMLNANGNRLGSTETCLPNASSATCPALKLDSLPH